MGRSSRAHQRLKKLSARYHELEHLFGTAQDHRRIAAYQRFYAGVIAFSERIRGFDPTMPRPAPRSLGEHLHRVRRWTLRFLARLGSLWRMVGVGFGILRVVIASRREGAGTPFTNCVGDLFRAYGELRG